MSYKYKLTNKRIREIAHNDCIEKSDDLDREYKLAEARATEASRIVFDTYGPIAFWTFGLIVAAAVLISSWFWLALFFGVYITIELSKIFHFRKNRICENLTDLRYKASSRCSEFDTKGRRAFIAARMRQLRAQR